MNINGRISKSVTLRCAKGWHNHGGIGINEGLILVNEEVQDEKYNIILTSYNGTRYDITKAYVDISKAFIDKDKVMSYVDAENNIDIAIGCLYYYDILNFGSCEYFDTIEEVTEVLLDYEVVEIVHNNNKYK